MADFDKPVGTRSSWLLKVRSQLTFTNIYSECIVKLLQMSVLSNKGKDGLQKLKQEEQRIITNCRVVVLALQCLGRQH